MKPNPSGEVSFEVEGQCYVLVFDFAAIAFFEQAADTSLIDAMAGMERAQAQGRTPKLSHLAFLLQAGFRKHHPDMTPDAALALASNPQVQRQLGVAVTAAMPDADDVGNGKAPAKKASTGTKSSRAPSKRG